MNVIVKSQDPIGTLTELLTPNLPAASRETTGSDLQRNAVAFQTTAKAVDEVARSPHLTLEGKRHHVARHVSEAQQALAALQTKTDRLAASAADMRTRILAPVTDRTAAQERDEEYAREQLAKMDPLMVAAKFHGACESGNTTIINAVRRAAAAGFPLVTGDALKRGEALMLQHSPLSAQLAAQENEAEILSTVLANTRAELDKLARKHGLILKVGASGHSVDDYARV